MADEASWDLQVAVYGLLHGHSPAIAGGRIYDNVPDEAAAAAAPDSAFPYVQLGEGTMVPEDADRSDGAGDDGVTETITLHVWSRYRGYKETKQILQQLKNLLHDAELAVPGRSSALAVVTLMRWFLDPDGKTRHGVLNVDVTHRN